MAGVIIAKAKGDRVDQHKIVTSSVHNFDAAGDAPPQAHSATKITSDTLDGDRLPAMSVTKKGGVPPTGTPTGLVLNDFGNWVTGGGGGGLSNLEGGAPDSVYGSINPIEGGGP